jgi:hypothetical protein
MFEKVLLSCFSHNISNLKLKHQQTNITMPAKKNQDVAEKGGKQNHAKNEKGGNAKPSAAGKIEKKAEKPS